MAKKSLGYVELEWTCKRCGTKNPGLQKTCPNCGAPMAIEDQFETPEEQKLITDQTKLDEAKKNPDIHCPYCGARNASGSTTCGQCGGDLTTAAAREEGKVVGAFQEGPAPEVGCPFCSAKIKANSPRCPNCGGELAAKLEKTSLTPTTQKKPLWAIIALVAFLVICFFSIGLFVILSTRTQEVRGQVQNVNWERVIAVQALQDVSRDTWEDQLPVEATVVSCEDRERETSSDPAPKSTEVCGTPYTVDQGSGLGEVVQDCVYLVYDNYCSYTVQEWQVVDRVAAQGNDFKPFWPDITLDPGQREGERQETYIVIFVADGKIIRYTVDNLEELTQFTPGSEWILKVNALGGVTEVSR